MGIIKWNNTLLYSTNRRITLAGTLLELHTYKKDFFIGDRPKSNKPEELRKKKPEATAEEKLIYKRNRAKKMFRHYVYSNMHIYRNEIGIKHKAIFMTLTFANNIQDIEYANREFTKFIQRLNLYITGKKTSYSKYVAVIEFQERGSIHYHILFFNLPFIKNIRDEVGRIWGYGMIDVSSKTSAKGAVKYMTKYLVKHFGDPRLQGKKSYFTSHNLKKPLIVYYDELIDQILLSIPENVDSHESDKIPTGYMGDLVYTSYDLGKKPKVLKRILEIIESTGYDGPAKSLPKEIMNI